MVPQTAQNATVKRTLHLEVPIALEFVAEGPEKTRVEFEHRHLERHGAGWEKMREEVGSDGGWPTILDLYVAAARQ